MTSDLGAGEPAAQIVLAVVVHQEADRAAVHAVDRHAVVEVAVQRLQHQAVAAQRDDGFGFPWLHVAIGLRQPLARLLGLGHVAGDERDLLEISRYALHLGSDPRLSRGSDPVIPEARSVA